MNKAFIMLLVVLATFASFADTLEPSAGPAVTGFFLSYDNGKINFMNSEQKSLHESPSGVRRVTLDQPLKATLEVKTKRGEKADIVLTGFEQGAFLVERGGKTEKVPLQTISVLLVDAIANERTTDRLGDSDNVISKGEETDLAKAVEAGKVTVIQFHLVGSLVSVRTGNYLTTLRRLSKGKLAVKRIIVSDAAAPVAKQHQVTTFPQFWIYGKTGQLSSKLTDRFTEADIDAAIKKASK